MKLRQIKRFHDRRPWYRLVAFYSPPGEWLTWSVRFRVRDLNLSRTIAERYRADVIQHFDRRTELNYIRFAND